MKATVIEVVRFRTRSFETLLPPVKVTDVMTKFTKASVRKTRHMDMVFNRITTEVDMKDNGSTTNNMVKEKNIGLMDQHSSVNTQKE